MSRSSSAAYTIWFVIVVVAAPGGTSGQEPGSWFESLVMPGEVAVKHAHVERQCGKCHAPFDKAAQDGLCLACHSDVAADVSAPHGYHGRVPAVRGQACKTCHTEHQGRRAEMVRLDRETFDHRLTDSPLLGAHAGVACDDCHPAGRRYREAATRCDDCHGRTDPHERSLERACDDCHSESAWTAVRFDHRTSAFALEGRHREARCEACHPTKRYRPTAKTCAGCHARDDQHRGTLGDACQSCHTSRAWPETAFDHLQRARFVLAGRHLQASCESCHAQKDARGQTPTACHGCHARDDAHRGQFGPACTSCHTPADWQRPTFDHDQRTRYPLRGRHREARCTGCHTGDLDAQRPDTGCHACHRQDDVHGGREGARCDKCHDERGWHSDVLFDHDATRFPLLGAHGRLACMQCHASPAFNDAISECVSCHEDVDVHRGAKGMRCADCHDQNTWRVPAAEDGRRRTPDPDAPGEAW
jgi:hypothetical protein